MNSLKNIAVFASGGGTNAEAIFQHFEQDKQINITRLLTNNKKAFALQRAANYQIPTTVFNREQFYESDAIVGLLQDEKTDMVVLAGFLWLIPVPLLTAFKGRMINIHPALLPAYGGKGMYGMHVHRAVKAAGEHESGITIHFVNERYDEGQVILQKTCALLPDDSPEDIAKKVQKLEHQYYPQVIDDLARK